MKTEAYLKIANIYYIIKDYNNTIATLDLIPNIKTENYNSLTVSYIYFYNIIIINIIALSNSRIILLCANI